MWNNVNNFLSLFSLLSVFGVFLIRISRVRTEYGELLRILCISPYSVRMRKNTDQKNSEYGHFLRTENLLRGSSTSKFSEITLTYECKTNTLEYNLEGYHNILASDNSKIRSMLLFAENKFDAVTNK